MNFLKSLALLLALATPAFASPQAVQHIDNASAILQVENQAIYSGRYRAYRPATIRGILSNLSREANSALAAASSHDGRDALRSLQRSLQEEYQYSFRFQLYRLASAQLLFNNYARFLRIAREAESGQHGRH